LTVNDREILRAVLGEVYGENLSRVILFGSRASGLARQDSDFDVLLVVKRPMTRDEVLALGHAARERLAALDMDVDLLVRSEAQIPLLRRVPGTAAFHALREGVHI